MTDIEEIREIFEHFDDDQDGRINRAEFGHLMDALGADAPEDELDMGFDLIDADDNGEIDFEEFAQWWANR
jgi:calmodulin